MIEIMQAPTRRGPVVETPQDRKLDILTVQPVAIFAGVIEMPRNAWGVLYGLAMIAVVVGVDLLFFRNRFWERLMANVGIVLLFGAFYLRFLKNR